MKRARYFPFFFTVLFLGTGIISCDETRVYEKYQPLKNAQWHKDSLMVFNIPVTDTLQNHHLLLSIRHDINYKYSNLWFFTEILQPKNEVLKDTPEKINEDPFGDGWIIRIKVSDPADLDGLMEAGAYKTFTEGLSD